MRAATELPTSELLMQLADLRAITVSSTGHADERQTSDVVARIEDLVAEIDRRIPVETYVRTPSWRRDTAPAVTKGIIIGRKFSAKRRR